MKLLFNKLIPALTLATSMIIVTGCNSAAIKTGAILSNKPSLIKGAMIVDAHQKEEKKLKHQKQKQEESKRRRVEYARKQAEHRRVLASMTREERAQYEIQQKKKEAEQTRQSANAMGVLGNILAPRPIIVSPY